jgi:putative heme-binding domain-containing protein
MRRMPYPRRLARALLCLALLGTAAPAAAQDHTYSSTDIATGVRIYGAQCQLCHGATGDTVAGVNLRIGRFRRAVTDDDLAQVMAKGVAPAMPGFSLTPAEANGVIAFIRAGFDPDGTAVKVGNVDRGKTLFAGKGACASCHRAGPEGPRSAPDLSDIGAVRTPAALQRALLEPTRAMPPINRPMTLQTTAGRTIRGRRVNEDTFSMQLVDDTGHLVTVVKKDLKSVEAGTTSPMPSVAKTLTPDEVADLVAFLVSLRGAQ